MGTFQLDKPNCQSETIQEYLKESYVENKKCGKSIMVHVYVLWKDKIHYFIIPTYKIPRENDLLPLVPYKSTYHILLDGIHTSYIAEVIGNDKYSAVYLI